MKVRSVLVSAYWNKNGHYFAPTELKAGYRSAIGKPQNVDHIDTQVVGVMTDSIPVTYPETMEIVDGNVQHVVVDSDVEYSKIVGLFGDEKAISVAGDIVSGSFGVSMECRPRDFDLILEMPDKSTFILPVNDETSILMAFVKDFGGPGFIGDEDNNSAIRVGLYLKGLEFVGNAFTHNPAGPRSKILSVKVLDEQKSVKANVGTEFTLKEDKMEEKTINAELETKVKELENLQATFDAIKAENETIKAAQAESLANIEKLTAELEEIKTTKTTLEASVTELTSKVSALELDKKVASRQFTTYKMGIEMTAEQLATFSDESFTVFCDTLNKQIDKAHTSTVDEVEAAKKKKCEDPEMCPDCKEPMDKCVCESKCKKKADEVEETKAEETKIEASEKPVFKADDKQGLPTEEGTKNNGFDARFVLNTLRGQ